MKMTAEEIVEMYDKDRTRDCMQRIADLNDCTIKEVGEFLKNAAQPKKKPGRPKKEQASKSPECEQTLKDNSEKVDNKSESVQGKKPRHSYMIPEVVVQATKEKIEDARRRAKFHEDKAQEYNLIVMECEDFLYGGFCNGEEDGLFRQV